MKPARVCQIGKKPERKHAFGYTTLAPMLGVCGECLVKVMKEDR